MVDENYIMKLQINDIPWQRLTTPYGRATLFPEYFNTLEKMDNLQKVKKAVSALTSNIEHQSTLWHASPFGIVFLMRILIKSLIESEHNPIAHFLTDKILRFILLILKTCQDVDKLEHESPLPIFSDLLKEEYLWPCNEDDDELRYEDCEVFSDKLFYSFYYYSRVAIFAYQDSLIKNIKKDFVIKINEILSYQPK